MYHVTCTCIMLITSQSFKEFDSLYKVQLSDLPTKLLFKNYYLNRKVKKKQWWNWSCILNSLTTCSGTMHTGGPLTTTGTSVCHFKWQGLSGCLSRHQKGPCEDFLLTKSRSNRWFKVLFWQKFFMLSMPEGNPGCERRGYIGEKPRGQAGRHGRLHERGRNDQVKENKLFNKKVGARHSQEDLSSLRGAFCCFLLQWLLRGLNPPKKYKCTRELRGTCIRRLSGDKKLFRV